MAHPEIIFYFLVIAFIYSSVGFGGGSSYLAILAMYSLPYKELRLIALICNIIVVAGGTIVFILHNEVKWKKILPIAIVSVPMAFFGASLKLKQDVFFIILGCSLLIAAVMLWLKTRRSDTVVPAEKNYVRDGLLGGVIGFLSGLVGIGGGIFLSPILNLLRWDNSRKIAATASVFILVNSLSGIAGQLTQVQEKINYNSILFLAIAVFVGGQFGSRMAAVKFNHLIVRRLTALLVFVAGIEILYKHLT